MLSRLPDIDSAGKVYPHPSFFETKDRIESVLDQYLTLEKLRARLEDLPVQFENPQPRLWQPIHWQTINQKQVVGIDLKIFLSIIVGAVNTEAPIRGYTQTSRQYLEPIHPQLARFVGGVVAEDGTMLELGLWEKEERQHAPALIKTYIQLTGNKPILSPHAPKSYKPLNNPGDDLYRHGLHRIITEYSAVCLYLRLMAHTTGTLQQVFAELLQDEINHMTKFWGFGIWLFPESYLSRMAGTFGQILTRQHSTQVSHIQPTAHLTRTFHRMMGVLDWNSWSWNHKLELVYTFIRVWHRLWRWSGSLTPEYLQQLFQ
ncbi:MAG: ferritin-like domain-containing protein [Aphanothece sp. CMT-3BRIN-NPC111]|jgi:hypothetical protein|nr:ferritin-like domain-containing protein [Aphanothece sp. CMT-3BRIN-NPC111]